ncbi:MAG TPA: hypothetical protein VFQ51_05070, partial [Vicinamibacteria bacterium]|nr:hypothetical protein [Vicinamibacteria bacterium]
PAQKPLAYLTGLVLVALGLAIVSGLLARTAATFLGAMILAMVVFLVPTTFFNPDIDRPLLRGFMYTNPLKSLALLGGAAMIAGRWPDVKRGLVGVSIGRWERLGPPLLAAFLFVGGFQHFWYRQFVDTLVPAWIPPSQRFWTLFAGVALMAGAVGLLVPRSARLAASLSGLMIFLWVILLHVPRALSLPAHAFEAAGVLEALALSGVALLVAGTRLPARAARAAEAA